MLDVSDGAGIIPRFDVSLGPTISRFHMICIDIEALTSPLHGLLEITGVEMDQREIAFDRNL